MKFVEDKNGRTLQDVPQKIFDDKTTMPRAIAPIFNKWDSIKLD